jgi:hypothetical protein
MWLVALLDWMQSSFSIISIFGHYTQSVVANVWWHCQYCQILATIIGVSDCNKIYSIFIPHDLFYTISHTTVVYFTLPPTKNVYPRDCAISDTFSLESIDQYPI